VKGFQSQHIADPPKEWESAEDTPAYHWSLPEVRIVVTYVFLASLWIIGSDVFLTNSTASESELGVIHSLKGLNFVLTTGVLLFFVLRRAYGGWRLAEEHRLLVIKQARERYRTLCSRVQSLREEDRTRIAREIHDELGQLLTGIKMELRMVENELAGRNDRSLNPAIDRLVELGEMVDSTISSIQRITADLRPSVLDHLGLAAALKEEAELFGMRSGILCHVEIDEIEALPPELETTIFRIFQESLTNVARHANAEHVVVSFFEENGALKLSVKDDGDGMDMAVLDDPGSLGLIGMAERAESMGGAVHFESLPQQGTEVIFTVPIPEQHP
jgi:signal transduction histidine kinase